MRRGDAIRELKKRDNYTNFVHIGLVYLVIVASIAARSGAISLVAAAGLGWWWNIPTTLVAIAAIGASQHQFGGVIHEGTHFILFDNKKLNELMSDWLAAFPIYTSTFQFRLHHLAHHQFINDPVRDPDWAQLQDSGHDLDFPITHFDMLRALLKQIWLPNLSATRWCGRATARLEPATIRISIGTSRRAAADAGRHHLRRRRTGSRHSARRYRARRLGACRARRLDGHHDHLFRAPRRRQASARARRNGHFAPDDQYQPHRLHGDRLRGRSRPSKPLDWAPAWTDYGLLWIIPLFTTFPLFMIMRQWVQHGNADRGRYTNTRVFLVNPFIRYAIFPFGMDYHLPHHIYASVPHFKLKGLHDLLLQDPDYREKGVVVEGYFNSPHGEVEERNPTVIEVLGDKYAPKPDGDVYIDTDTLEYAEVKNPEAIARQNEASVRGS